MALRNVLRAFDQISLSTGCPAAGGKVYLFEPGTDTPITSYRDSLLIGIHTHPVQLSGSGRAEIWVTRNCDMVITDRNDNPITPTSRNINPDNAGNAQDGGLVSNGSFEEDANADGIPDSWIASTEPGGIVAIDTAESTDGRQSVRITSTGTGGGEIVSEQFFPVNDSDTLRINIDVRSDTLNRLNRVVVDWYDISQVLISSSDVFASNSLGSAFQTLELIGNPPANSRFAKMRLVGIDPSTPGAGNVWFDRLQVFYPAVVSGTFDNITIQNNEIVTTNANGNLDLAPNGTGNVVVRNGYVRVRSVGDTDAEDRLLSFEHSDGTERGLVGHSASEQFSVSNLIEGGALELEVRRPGGVRHPALLAEAEGETSLYYDGVRRVSTESAGRMSLIGDNNSDTQQSFLEFDRADLVRRGFLGYSSSGRFEMRNELQGEEVSLLYSDSGGTIRNGVRAGVDGRTQLYHLASERLRTEPNGVVGVIGDDDTNTQQVSVRFRNSSLLNLGSVGFSNPADSHFYLSNAIAGGLVRIFAQDNSGTPGEMARFDRNGSAIFWHAATSVVETVAAAAGGMRVRNDDTGSGFERVLTESDLDQVGQVNAVRSTNVTRTNTATLAADTELQMPLSTGRWKIKFSLLVNITGPIGNGIKLRIGNISGAMSSHYYGQYQVDQPSLIPSDASMFSSSSNFGVSLLLNDTTARIIEGGAIVNCTTAGDLALLWSLIDADSDNLTVFAGSWISAEKVD